MDKNNNLIKFEYFIKTADSQDFNANDKENIEILARVSFDSLDKNNTGEITKSQF